MAHCGKCTKYVNEEVECKGCDAFFHYKCTTITETSWKTMSGARKNKWRCSSCRNSDTVISDTQEDKAEGSEKGKIDEILKIVKNQSAEVTAILLKMDQLSEELTAVKKELKKKDELIKTPEKKLNAVEQCGRNTNIEIHNVEEEEEEED